MWTGILIGLGIIVVGMVSALAIGLWIIKDIMKGNWM